MRDLLGPPEWPGFASPGARGVTHPSRHAPVGRVARLGRAHRQDESELEPPPSRVRPPQVARLVGEQEDLTLTYRQQPFKHAVSINCDGRGAPLTLERLERHVRCGYCNATSELPEAVWRRLLPIAGPPFIYALLSGLLCLLAPARALADDEAGIPF